MSVALIGGSEAKVAGRSFRGSTGAHLMMHVLFRDKRQGKPKEKKWIAATPNEDSLCERES